MNNPVIPIILCGGSGTRLWPLSRESYPKQYLSLDTNNKKSLLQKTFERISKIENILSPILVCNEEHRFIVAEQMRSIGVEPLSILLEPFGKNTAPAISLAALKSIEEENDPILLILSSDHEIKNEKRFCQVINRGIEYALKNKLITFGVLPSSPETGYGYIKAKNPFKNGEIHGEKIESFFEKPNLETAKIFIKDKSFTWNSGIFMFKAKKILKEINKYSPEILNCCRESISKSIKDLEFQRLDNKSFSKCPNESIDVSVMEKTSEGIVLPLDAEWSDIGSWQAVWEISKKNNQGNFTQGKVFVEDTKDCYLRSENRLLVGIGLENLIIVETKDAILISDKNKTQNVKEIVKKLKIKGIQEGQKHTKIYRPWGSYESIIEDLKWQVKLIEVKPGEKLSLQMHHHRAEHWIVVKGQAKIEINNKIQFLTKNQSTYIPQGAKHRLSNNGNDPLFLIEVQSGSYIGEDDIIRFEDKYGRIK